MDRVDLLVIGPHPDDLEIGLGGSIARHVAMGLQVGLCDLTAGEMGSNGTVEQRIAESEDARRVLGAAWRENLRLPDREIGKHPDHLKRVASFVRRHRPRDPCGFDTGEWPGRRVAGDGGCGRASR